MGQGHHKGHSDKTPLLSEREKKLVRDVWDAFCKKHRDYGSIILSSFFVAHPDLQKLFPAFRDKPVRILKDDVKFRNHAIKFGDQLNSLIEALDKPAVLTDLMRKTSNLHAGHKGVKPEHFVTMGRVIINVLTANHDRLMTGPTVKAWEKLFVAMQDSVTGAMEEMVAKSQSNAYKLAAMSTADFAASRRQSKLNVRGQDSMTTTSSGQAGPSSDAKQKPGEAGGLARKPSKASSTVEAGGLARRPSKASSTVEAGGLARRPSKASSTASLKKAAEPKPPGSESKIKAAPKKPDDKK